LDCYGNRRRHPSEEALSKSQARLRYTLSERGPLISCWEFDPWHSYVVLPQAAAKDAEIAALTKERDEARKKLWDEGAISTGRLHDMVVALREALEPFKQAVDRIEYFEDGLGDVDWPIFTEDSRDNCLNELLDGIEGERLTVAHLRRARAALDMSGGVK
jgi:hypothetical protein